MKKISLARRLEERKLISLLKSHVRGKRLKAVDLGGELNHYHSLFGTFFSEVITYNLAEKNPSRVVDLTHDIYPLLCLDRPDFIFSINTIEHLSDDLPLFQSCLRYASAHHAQIIIICPFLHKIHAQPYDFRRHTIFGIRAIIENAAQAHRDKEFSINYDIDNVGGSLYTLIASLLHQKSLVIGLIAEPPLLILDYIEKILKRILAKPGAKSSVREYPLGYVITIKSYQK